MNADVELPGFFKDADAASLAAQHTFLALSRLRLVSTVAGAIGGVLSWSFLGVGIGAVVALAGFLVALIAELILAFLQPERNWYSGRALAESIKTMSWCYAVGADPFGPDVEEAKARTTLRERAEQVAQKAGDTIAISAGDPLVTDSMTRLRYSDFETRRRAYLALRTRDQRNWYAAKARENKRLADAWRAALISAEIVAVAVSALKTFSVLGIDIAGVLGAGIGAGAAWLSLKQHAQLAAAYGVASRELALQEDLLSQVPQDDWPRAVADAEAAISREHTMWLASRSS